MATEINEGLAKQINELGGRAQSLNFKTTNVLKGERILLAGTENGEQRSTWAYVGNGDESRSCDDRDTCATQASCR